MMVLCIYKGIKRSGGSNLVDLVFEDFEGVERVYTVSQRFLLDLNDVLDGEELEKFDIFVDIILDKSGLADYDIISIDKMVIK